MRIKNIVDIQIGYQFRGRITPDPDGTHLVIQIKDIDEDHRLSTRNIYRVVLDRDADRYLVKPGDVLFVSKGSRYIAVAIDRDLGPAVAAGHFFVLRPRRGNVLPEYLAWYINQEPAQRFLNQNKRGTLMPIVPRGVFEQMELPIPPLKTQETIIKVDELARKEVRIVAKIQNKRARLAGALCLQAAQCLD